jgi:hypothetical protein
MWRYRSNPIRHGDWFGNGNVKVIPHRERPEDVLSMQVWEDQDEAGESREGIAAVVGLSARKSTGG